MSIFIRFFFGIVFCEQNIRLAHSRVRLLFLNNYNLFYWWTTFCFSPISPTHTFTSLSPLFLHLDFSLNGLVKICQSCSLSLSTLSLSLYSLSLSLSLSLSTFPPFPSTRLFYLDHHPLKLALHPRTRYPFLLAGHKLSLRTSSNSCARRGRHS